MTMHEYTIDLRLCASIRVKAETEEQAHDMIREYMDAASCNAGEWPNGDTIVFEASLDDGLYTLEIDGERA